MVRVQGTTVTHTDVEVGDELNAVAGCPVGKVAYGGGGNLAESSADVQVLLSSYPITDRIWAYSALVTQDFDTPSPPFIANDSVNITAYAVCGNP